eukprot:TRINITY_DN28819_c0_g1_i2.p1 TRINITY_DN28819_c0_g1~~TRINITY_DN28819_c0_g1_i2.p1  ORF type:complete len:235 (+),score=43.15 TRINITY_DN28819_c0_g1_i2:64-768(+)
MGGHGGLNILPQKRWNVFNRDNRSKVEKDEREYQEQLEKQKEQQIRLEAERKREQLLARQGITKNAEQEQPKFINFWAQEEAGNQSSQQPEHKEQQRAEKRKRGNPDQYTSDAKFDEKFQFAYGVKDEQPWYTKKQKQLPPNNQTKKITEKNINVKDGHQLLNQLQTNVENDLSETIQDKSDEGYLCSMGVKLLTTKEMKKNMQKKQKKDKNKKKEQEEKKQKQSKRVNKKRGT